MRLQSSFTLASPPASVPLSDVGSVFWKPRVAVKSWALAAEDAARAIPGVTNSEGGGASAGVVVMALATSTGFRGGKRSTSHGTSASVVAGSGSDMQRDYAWHSARHLADLESPEDIGLRAGQRAISRLNPIKLNSGAMPILFDPRVSTSLLGHLADSIATYVRYQIDAGAQVVQLFDSWAGQLSPIDYDTFAAPYQKRVIDQVKATHPDTPLILYISGSAGVLERLARLAGHVGVQGNVDPGLLFGSPEGIRERIFDTVRKASGRRHILNLGHGILPGTPEENARVFFETGKNVRELMGAAV